MTDWVVRSKLAPSVRLRHPVPRPRLLARLSEALDARVAVVHAPAGYGKSSLLAQWHDRLRAQAVPVAWLSLDEHDTDPFQFLNYLIEACKSAGFAAGVDLVNSPHGFSASGPAAASSALLTALGRSEGPHAIVIDDYHRAECPEVGALLDYLQQALPPNLHLVISARQFPRSLSVADLRAHDELLELDQSDLRFDPEEIAAFVGQAAGEAVSAEAAGALYERTEGWPIALQAARRWLEEGVPLAQTLEQFSGRTSDLVDYFVEQVFDGLSGADQTLLLSTSILERVNGDVATALCGSNDCWRQLEHLEQRDLFVHSLDRERAWYRYHRLFSEFLQERLRRSGGPPVSELHARAARWFQSHGHSTEAVQHALACGDAQLLAEVLEALGGWHYALLGHVGAFERALAVIPREALERHPRLALAEIYLDVRLGEHAQARRKLDSLSGLHGATKDSGLAAEFHIMDCLLDRYAGREVTESQLAELERLTDPLPVDNHVMRAVSCNLQCAMHARLGRAEEAFAVGERAIGHFREIRSVYGETFIYFHQGQARLVQGRLRDAEALYREGFDLAVEHFGDESDLAAIGRALLAEVAYEKHQAHEAARLLERALPHIEQFDSWPEVYEAAYFTGARLAAARGDGDALAAIARRVSATTRSRALPDLGELMAARLVAVSAAAGLPCPVAEPALAEADLDVPDLRLRQARVAALAQVRLAEDQPLAAETLLAPEAERAYGQRHLRAFVALSIQRAIALWQLGRPADARGVLEKALAAALFELLKRPFIDAGTALLPVLRDLTRRSEGRRRNGLRDTFLAELVLEIGRRDEVAEPEGPLSRREREVLGHLMQGRSNREIAEAVPLSVNTVKFHLKNLFDKLGVSNRQEAVTVAIRRGLI